MKLVIFCPGKKMGGTNTLFARVAECWEAVTGGIPDIIDFEDGVIKNYLDEKKVKFNLRVHKYGKKHFFSSTDIVIMPVLAGRTIGYKLFPDDNTRICFWITHPNDPFKWLPSFQFFGKMKYINKMRAAKFFHPFYFRKLQNVFYLASRNGGLVAMDSDCNDSLELSLDINCKLPIIPVITEQQSFSYHFKSKIVRFCWVGRLADFKSCTVISLAKEISCLRVKGYDFYFDIIGDGAHSELVKSEIKKLKNPNINFLGTIPIGELNPHLIDKVDIFCGHGISMLEAAKFGVPCIVADGHYFDMKVNEAGYSWFHKTPDGDVGKIILDKNGFPVSHFNSLINEKYLTQLNEIGRLTYDKWSKCHSPVKVVKALHQSIKKNTFQYKTLKSTKFEKFDFLGGVIISIKRYITKNKY